MVFGYFWIRKKKVVYEKQYPVGYVYFTINETWNKTITFL